MRIGQADYVTEDAYCKSGGTPQGGTYVEISDDGTDDFYGFFRFQCNFPRGANLQSNSNLWFTFAADWSTTFSFDVHCEDIGNSPTFGGAEDLTARTLTTAFTRVTPSTTYSAGDSGVVSLQDPLQEVLNRSDFEQGNYVTIVMKHYDAVHTDDDLRIASIEHVTYNEALPWIFAKQPVNLEAPGGLVL